MSGGLRPRFFGSALLLLAVAAAPPSVTPALAQTPQVIENPDLLASETANAIALQDFAGAAQRLADSVGNSEAKTAISGPLAPWSAAHSSRLDKVIDQKFGNSLHQIVYMVAFDDVDFLYLRYNFKRNSKGWILTDFTFKNETRELFPADFVFGQ